MTKSELRLGRGQVTNDDLDREIWSSGTHLCNGLLRSGWGAFRIAGVGSSAPNISVILVCKNPGACLVEAGESVLSQEGADFELVVADGGSNDGTLEVLVGWKADSRVRVLEGPDRGIYDGMNRALREARGEWILFMGADDRLVAADVLRRAAERLRDSRADVAAGRARYVDGRWYGLPENPRPVWRNFIHHQATFYRRSVIERYPFDLRWRIQADYDVNLKLWKSGVSFAPMDLHVSDCGTGGASDGGSWANYREEIAVRHAHFPWRRCLLPDAGSVVRWVRKQGVRVRRRRVEKKWRNVA